MARLALLVGLMFALVTPASAQRLTLPQKAARAAGKALGVGGGVVVTAALVFFKKWNAPMHDDQGHIAKLEVPGYSFTLRERHRPVKGPQYLAEAAQMKQDTKLQRLRYNFVYGKGLGATIAPPLEARIEAHTLAGLRELGRLNVLY